MAKFVMMYEDNSGSMNNQFFEELIQCNNSEELRKEVNWFFNACRMA